MILGISGKISSGKDTVGKIIQALLYNQNRVNGGFQPMDVISILDDERRIASSNWQIKKFADKLKDMVCLLIGCTREQLEDAEFKNTPLPQEWWYYKSGNIITLYPDEKYESFGDRYTVKLTPRLLLQLLGTECGRNIIHPNIWVNALMAEYKPVNNCTQHSDGLFYTDEHGLNEVVPQYPNWIITDMRFPNELGAVKKKDGISIRVNRIEKGKAYLINSTIFSMKSNIKVVASDDVRGYDEVVFIDSERKVYRTSDYHIVRKDEHSSEIALDNAEFDYTIYNNGTIEELIEKVKQILIKEKISCQS